MTEPPLQNKNLQLLLTKPVVSQFHAKNNQILIPTHLLEKEAENVLEENLVGEISNFKQRIRREHLPLKVPGEMPAVKGEMPAVKGEIPTVKGETTVKEVFKRVQIQDESSPSMPELEGPEIEKQGEEEQREEEEEEEKEEEEEPVEAPNIKFVEEPQKIEKSEKPAPKRITKKNKPVLIANLTRKQMVNFGQTPLNKRLPKPGPDDFIFKAPSYYMNNREMFIQSVNAMFGEYKRSLLDETKNITCDNIYNDDNSISLLTHQRIVRDYMNLYTPYRGLLLYHGLGSGKTCSSIAIAEAMKSRKQIFILTPASLHANYLEQIKKCGDAYYKKQQYWEWISVINDKPLLETLSSILNLPIDFITTNRGAWVVDVSKHTSNYDTLTKLGDVNNENIGENQFILNKQLDIMIEQKYKFIHYNGLRSNSYNALIEKYGGGNMFNNSVVIIDEAHNLISRIVNQINKLKNAGKQVSTTTRSSKVNPLSIRIYKDLMNAENARVVLLTGTPIINYPNEIAVLFNILRGSIKMYKFDLNTKGSLDLNRIKNNILRDDVELDYVDYNPTNSILSITRNPFGFQTNVDNKGVVDRHSAYLNDANFIQYIRDIFIRNGVTINVTKTNPTVEIYTALPDSLEDFNNEFIDSELNNSGKEYSFKNSLKFKHRIIGLTSYFRSAQEELLPRYDKAKNFHIEHIPMSEYQFIQYETIRQIERKTEKSNKNKKGKKNKNDDVLNEVNSTFKIYSRLACNFVTPPNIPRPIPDRIEDQVNECANENKCEDEPVAAVDENNLDVVANMDFRIDAELEADEILEKNLDYRQRVLACVAQIRKEAPTVLSKEGLAMYSPKFLKMINNIQSGEHVGLHLIYSQFRSLEGIELFTAALDQNGFVNFKIKQVGGVWRLDFNPTLLQTKSAYALYTGVETSVEREILRNIYNGYWKDVPKSLSDVLRPISETNEMGQLIKVLMITAAGSEGINLLNTRYVHIMEPYWNPVRIEQVVGRARRICSHQKLPLELQTVDVFLYLMVFTPEQLKGPNSVELRKNDVSKTNSSAVFSSDQLLYEISSIKEALIYQLLKAVKEASIDCATHIKSSANEKLSCLSFGDLKNTNDFVYKPDISMDQDDKTILANRQTKNVGNYAKIRDPSSNIEYMMDKDTQQLFDVDSYQRAMTAKDSTLLVLVGNVVDGVIVLNR
jgi:hypothetical protein